MMGYLSERKQTMKAPATQAYRQTLERMRDALLERMSAQRDGKVSRAEVAFEQFDHSQDDPGLINSQRDLAFAIDENEIAQLQAIDDALARITQGVYGCARHAAVRYLTHVCKSHPKPCVAQLAKPLLKPHTLPIKKAHHVHLPCHRLDRPTRSPCADV
jgi:DnaK suppressor protein